MNEGIAVNAKRLKAKAKLEKAYAKEHRQVVKGFEAKLTKHRDRALQRMQVTAHHFRFDHSRVMTKHYKQAGV